MEMVLYILVAAALAAALVWLFLRQRKAKGEQGIYSDLDRLGIPRHKALFQWEGATPSGVRVRSTVAVPSLALADIDAGLQTQIDRWNAAFPHYKKGRTLGAEYSVLFVEPMAWNQETWPGSPAILVQGTQAAGTCIGEVRSGWPLKHMVLPHQQDSNWSFREYLRESVRHESEHLRPSWENDVETYDRFRGDGDIHPHIP